MLSSNSTEEGIMAAWNGSTLHENDTYSDRLAEAECLESISSFIRNTYIWIIFAFGFPGNVFAIVTVLTMHIMTPATFFVAMLAICDGSTLVFKLILHQISLHAVYRGDFGCKMGFITVALSTLANWFLVVICAERYVSVCHPLKKAFLVTKRRSYILASVISCIFIVFFISIFVVMRASDDAGLQCGTIDEYVPFWVNGWYYLNAALYIFIPLPCIALFTAFVIRGLSISRKDRRSIFRNGSGRQQENNRRVLEGAERVERSITIMLVITALTFTVLTLPACIHLLAYKETGDRLSEARWELFNQIGYLLADSSHAVNFFLYFLSAQRFRNQFIYIITCHRYPASRRRSMHMEQTHATLLTKYSIAKSSEDVSHV